MPRLKKARKQELPWNYAQAHMQLHLIIPPTKIFFSFKLEQCFCDHFLNIMLYFRISQKVTQVKMRLLT